MRRILFTYERNIPTVSLTYEMFHRSEFISQGMKVTFKQVKDITNDDITNNDVLYMMRPCDVISAKLAKHAQKSGLFVIFFCDDDLFHLPKDLPNIPYRRRMLAKCLRYANMMITNSEFFAKQQYQNSIEKRYFLINTIVDSSEMVSHKDNKVTKFLYAGSVTHKTLFEKLIAPIFDELVNKYGKSISFTFIGVHPEVESYQDKTNIEFYPSMPLEKYREFVKANNFDYGIAPLVGNDFTKCKYFNKYLEYSLSGVVGIYSKVEPYTFVIKNGENGYLVEDDPKEWLKTLESIIENKSGRSNIVETAQTDIKENFSAEKIFGEIFKNIPELLMFERGTKRVFGLGLASLNYSIHRISDIIYLVVFHLFHKGPIGLIKQIRLHRKEMKIMKKLEEK